jgi:eukaryotic-like serine/threonine-protein kinase
VVEKCIGQGGMGRVYRALDLRVSRHVAVKVLFGSVAEDEKARARFKKEAEAAGRLAHPNLVSVSDYDEWDGHVFLVMDYVEGVNLADIVYTEAPVSAERVVGLTRQLAAGLQHAHERGLIHRDFKPANIIVVREGNEERPRILDFGLAILADTESHRLTTNGLVLGTPAFMSPEQACGEPIDHRSDLFALGLIMYEMLAGKHPFDGTAAAIARQNLAADPPPLRKRAPEAKVPAELEAVVFRLLEKEPARRFQSGAELIETLDHIFMAPSVRAASASLSLPKSMMAPRRTWPWVTAGVAALLLAAGAVWWLESAPQQLAAGEPRAEGAGDAPSHAPAASPDTPTAIAIGVANEPAPAPTTETPGAVPDTAPEDTPETTANTTADIATQIPDPTADTSNAEADQAPERSPSRRHKRASRRKTGRRAENAAATAGDDGVISLEEFRARYYAVGAQVDRLERKRGSGAARPLRERYLAIPYFDAVRVESLRRDVYGKLADIARDARRDLNR